MKIKTLLITPLALALATTASNAALVSIDNADFEANGPGFVQATSWDGVNTARVADHASFRNQSALFGGGLHFAFTQGTTGPAEQTLSTTYVEGDIYTLSTNANYGGGDVGVDAILTLGYDAGAGFVIVGQTTFDLDIGAGAAGTSWLVASSGAFTADTGAAGQDIIIRIQSSATQGLWFDNVELDAVPEPSTALLAGLGILGLIRRRR